MKTLEGKGIVMLILGIASGLFAGDERFIEAFIFLIFGLFIEVATKEKQYKNGTRKKEK